MTTSSRRGREDFCWRPPTIVPKLLPLFRDQLSNTRNKISSWDFHGVTRRQGEDLLYCRVYAFGYIKSDCPGLGKDLEPNADIEYGTIFTFIQMHILLTFKTAIFWGLFSDCMISLTVKKTTDRVMSINQHPHLNLEHNTIKLKQHNFT